MSEVLESLLSTALDSREGWLAELQSHPGGPTTAFRLFHGSTEGRPGLTVDRYGDTVLVQTFREPLTVEEFAQIEAFATSERAAAHLSESTHVVWNHRGKPAAETPEPPASAHHPSVIREHGLGYLFQARHKGRDPWLYLDFRAGRRAIAERAAGKRVLNLFSYTCGASVAALAGGAKEAWSVDFAESALTVGKDNVGLNRKLIIEAGADGAPSPKRRHRVEKADVIPTLRQLAGLKVKGRGARRRYPRFDARRFDLVILDPPTFARTPFGAVDLVRDYPSLFKPAVLATAKRGSLLATNHVAKVDLDDWLDVLRRCAAKAGRPIADIEVISPDPDFPSPDDKPPLKMAWCQL